MKTGKILPRVAVLAGLVFTLFAVPRPARGQGAPTQLSTQQLTLLPQNPVALVTNVQSAPSIEGSTTYYYWFVTTVAGVISPPAGPFPSFNSPDTLGGINTITVNWTPVEGLATYDVLRTTTTATPTGACGCAVVTATASASLVDNTPTASLGAYTVATTASQLPCIMTNMKFCPLGPGFNVDSFGDVTIAPISPNQDVALNVFGNIPLGGIHGISPDVVDFYANGEASPNWGLAIKQVRGAAQELELQLQDGLGRTAIILPDVIQLSDSAGNTLQFTDGGSNLVGLSLAMIPNAGVYDQAFAFSIQGDNSGTNDIQNWLGFGSSTPVDFVDNAGNFHLGASVFDSLASKGTNGEILSSTGIGTKWIPAVAATPAIQSSAVVTLGADVPLTSGTPATILTASVTMPASGCPCRVLVSYGVYATTNNQTFNLWVSDATNVMASAETTGAGTNSTGISASQVSPVTYANSAVVTFTLTGLDNGVGGTIKAAPAQGSGGNSWMSTSVLTSQ